MNLFFVVVIMPFIIGTIIGIGLFLHSYYQSKKNIERLNENTQFRKNIQYTTNMMINKGYTVTKIIYELIIDEQHKVWTGAGLPYIFKWADIIEISYNENGVKQVINNNTCVENNVKNSLTSKNIITEVNTISVEVIVNNQKYPSVNFSLYAGAPIKTDSTTYKNILSLKKKLLTQLKYMQFQPVINSHSVNTQYKQDVYDDQSIIKYSKLNNIVNDYIVLSVQTTGLEYVKDKIVEIAAVKYKSGEKQEEFHTYVNPHKVIKKEITAINNVTNAQVRTAPDIKFALENFLLFAEDYTFITYNSDFVMEFLQYNCFQIFGHTLKNNVIDALSLSKRYLTDLPNHKLSTVQNHFKIVDTFGNAFNKCFVINYLYQHFFQSEKERFKYAIPFFNKKYELNQKEIEYINILFEIIKKNMNDPQDVSMYKTNKYLIISSENNDNVYIRLKLSGDLQYVLLNVPFAQFKSKEKTDIKYTAEDFEEEGTRLFLERPEQLWDFQKYLVKKQWSKN